jgi:DNA-binding IclR family transcriptional regulator
MKVDEMNTRTTMRAKREIAIMKLLEKRGMTIADLVRATSIKRSTLISILVDLVEAELVHRHIGTKQYVLDSGEFLHLEPDPDLAWMQR